MSNSGFAYLGAALLIAVMVILIGAGTFDNPSSEHVHVSQTPQPPAKDDPHGGVDMSNLQEINRLQNIVEQNPNDLESLLKLAHLLNDSKFYEKAIETYKKYLSIKPNSPDVLVDMGVCYFELKNYDTAIATMKKAIEIDPKHQIAHFNIGIVTFSTDRPKEAKEWWRKAVEIDPTSDVGKKSQELINSY